jgi:hypothetical protein
MPFDIVTPMNRLAAILTSLDGMQSVKIGVPESLTTTVSSYVTFGGFRVVDIATQLLQLEARFLVTFGYRVQGAEALAEIKTGQFITTFLEAIFTERRDQNSALYQVGLDVNLADEPQYQPLAGSDVRRYPIIVVKRLQSTPP